jgi:hypothetical protein
LLTWKKKDSEDDVFGFGCAALRFCLFFSSIRLILRFKFRKEWEK